MGSNDSISGRRKASGIMLMTTGAPNALMGLLVFIGSLIGGIVLGIIALKMIFGDSGTDDPLGELCFVFILILVIIGLIICVIAIILSAGFSIILAGQVIGGYFTFRGKHFVRSLVLSILGTLTSTFLGIVFVIIGIAHINEGGFFLFLIIGLLELILFPISTAGIVLMIKSRSSFSNKKTKK